MTFNVSTMTLRSCSLFVTVCSMWIVLLTQDILLITGFIITLICSVLGVGIFIHIHFSIHLIVCLTIKLLIMHEDAKIVIMSNLNIHFLG